MQSLLYSTFLIGATFLWGTLFYRQDFHPQPLRKIAQIFGIGLFSVLPVFAYKSAYQTFFPMLAEHRLIEPLLSQPLAQGFFFFALNLLLLSVILFAATGLLTFTLTFFKQGTLKNIHKALKEEEFEFIAVSMMIGLMIFFESALERLLSIPIVSTLLGTLLFLTVIEEYVKHLIVRFVDDKKIRDIDDAITFSVMVGLAFSLIETFIYVFKGMELNLIVYRSLLSAPIHLVASGIFGYYYGLAHFAAPLTEANRKKGRLKWLYTLLTLNRATVHKEEKIIEGLAFATLFHASANLLFEFGLAFLSIPFIALGLLLLSFMYKESHALYTLLK